MVDMRGAWRHTLTKEQLEKMQNQPKRDFAKYNEDGSENTSYRGPNIPYEFSNNPKPGQWDGRKMSQRMIADYKRFDVVDGEGVRNVIFVSGCPFRCKNCFQPAIFSFKTGFEYTKELEDKIIDDLKYSFVQGVTFLGGEPMLNTPTLLPLAHRIRETYGDSKDIWCWTGYTWEELHRSGETPDKLELLSMVDILVDGRFIQSLADPLLQFRGSSNQRIIDVKKSVQEGKVHIWDKLHDEHLKIKEIGVEERNRLETTEN